jgi:hypothetical protein
MFEEILQLECSVVWSYGDAISIAYPLAKIDTIDEETGTMHDDSALSLVVYGVNLSRKIFTHKIIGNRGTPRAIRRPPRKHIRRQVEELWEEKVIFFTNYIRAFSRQEKMSP